ncbi:MAG: hypothetical protein HXY19_08170 [Thermoanaerobaculaceae bacterium]|nr:hypothetical protein [Thermoanaerobaculaceae bacterium]
MVPRLHLFAVAVALLLPSLPGQAREYTHQKYFEHYEGTATCLQCHAEEARSFFHSQHYQWRSATAKIVNGGGKEFGKINVINDFCTAVGPSWIGLTNNSRGEAISKGCSKCHAGLGRLPEPGESPEQLANIDCLMCHAAGYNRDLYQRTDGGWEWRPVLWKNPEGLDSVAKRIGRPTTTSCLRCHAGSGGGPNFKRGDLEYAVTERDRTFDVHLAKDGAGLDCLDCHGGSDHKVRGRGADLFGDEMPDRPLGCDDAACHGSAPHTVEALNLHTARVACQSCHIPTFAKADPTDMVRDWSTPAYHQEQDKWSATITMAKDVVPVYAWYNGTTRAQLPGVAVTRGRDGRVGMMLPQGDRSDPRAKIYPFKRHLAKMPVLVGKNWLLPIAVEEFFASGQLDAAVKKGAEEFYGVKDAAYEWVETVRYMGISHEVVPARGALGCLDCHSPKGRLDWQALGYRGDPLVAAMRAAHGKR